MTQTKQNDQAALDAFKKELVAAEDAYVAEMDTLIEQIQERKANELRASLNTPQT